MKNILLLLLAFTLLCANCRKPHHEEGFYFQCKVNGKEYIPNGCANCITCTIYQDTIFLLGGNRGFEALAMGIIVKPKIEIGIYRLNNSLRNGGTYKNSTQANDRYDTDSLRKGILRISNLDNINEIISGSFYFKAYNALRNDSVTVSDGIFRLRYNNN